MQIQIGIRPEHREETIRLYAMALERKFQKILGSPEVVIGLMKAGLNLACAISTVTEENELVGISGFQMGEESLTKIPFSNFTK
jgi:hypothetical protein